MEQNKIISQSDFFQSIVDNVPDMIFVKEAKELRFVLFNKAGAELLGYSMKDMIGKNDYDFFPKDQADFFITKDRMTLNKKILLEIPEEPIQTRNKGVRFLHTKKIPILDEKGEPKYLLGISEDITERKKMEDIKKAGEKNASIIENSTDQIFMLDRNYKFLSINKIAAEIIGKSVEDIIGKSIMEVFPEATAAQFSKNIKNVFDAGKSMSVDEKIVIKDREFYSNSMLNPIMDARGRVVAVVGIVRDITSRKLLEQKLSEHAVDLEKEVAERTKNLSDKIKELESMNKIMVGRELKMVELKQRIKELEKSQK